MFYPLVALFILSALGFYLGKTKSIKLSKSQKLASLPNYYGYLSLFYILIPSLLLWFVLLTTQELILNKYIYSLMKEAIHTYEANELNLLFSKIQNIALGSSFGNETEFELFAASKVIHFKKIFILFTYFIILLSSILGFLVVNRKITPLFKSQRVVEKIVNRFIQLCSFIAILVTLGIFLSLVFETIQFFGYVNPLDFLLGLNWNPNKAFVIDSAEQIDKAVLKDAFGIIPLMGGTLLIALLAMMVAIPLGLMSAIYMSEYASKKVRDISKPVIEILAGIPTVVYGFFAALVVAPKIVEFGSFLGIEVSSESALAAGLTMGVMIIPFVSSLSDDVIRAVPQSLREGSYALGATKSETIIKVILPSALPGIIGSFLLAISRAIGETMIVVMAAGLAANLSVNPLDAVTTVTSQIVTILVGDQEFESAKTLSAFALALTLIIITLVLNFSALQIVKKYREHYE